MLFLWHNSSVDIDKIKLISEFPVWILSLHYFVKYAHFTVSYYCIGYFVGNYYVDITNRQPASIFPNKWIYKKCVAGKIIIYLKASTDVKHSSFLRNMGGWGCGSQNGPLIVQVCIVQISSILMD